MTTPVNPVLREMRWWDIDPVLELEKNLFPEDAWSRGMFWSELAHSRGPTATRRYVVAEAGERLVGYAGLALAGTAADGDTGNGSDAGPGAGADVQTIAVARDHWGTGLGSVLLTELLRAATAFECAEVMLECRIDNIRAQKLYERFGFEAIGFRRGYYQPGNVDALVMRLTTASDSGLATGPTSERGTEING
ncbi:GNAT family N-acetyltransferase [Streptomyces sp. NBC_00285]|uniref:GNAT family N-acetyltransferase n=1 Tax=Streptomyces sp. NBC_00285 TaxID=2975700 RepID=UPI002E2C726A|nr:GNAT family N-acetyltransferase [Streptomyces sp. NBC_00285]